MHKVLIPLGLLGSSDAIGCKSFIRASYLRKITDRGLFPLLVSPLSPRPVIDAALEEADGLLLMGGEDIHPARYQEAAHERTAPAHSERDNSEFYILEQAVKRRMPVLGICRGMQVIGVFSGGALHQHVPDLNSGEQHGLGEGADYDDLVTSHTHAVHIDGGSRAAQLLGKESVVTNSAHHQSVRSVGKDFVISGRSNAGISEIIEHRDADYFCFGIQSHPEAILGSGGELEPFFDRFKQSVEQYRSR